MKPLIDPVEGFFSGFTSAWSRLLLFFIVAFLGHAFGYIAAYTIEGHPFSIAVGVDKRALLPISFFCRFCCKPT